MLASLRLRLIRRRYRDILHAIVDRDGLLRHLDRSDDRKRHPGIEDCPLDEDDFGRKYQISDETPVQVTPMTIDQDLIKTIEKTSVTPRKPISNTPHRSDERRNEKEAR